MVGRRIQRQRVADREGTAKAQHRGRTGLIPGCRKGEIMTKIAKGARALVRSLGCAAVGATVLSVAACGASSSASGSTSNGHFTMRISAIGVDPGSPVYEGALAFQKLAQQKSDGRLTVQVFSGSTLGSSSAQEQQVTQGSLQMMFAGAIGTATPTGQTAEASELPYVFPDGREGMYKALSGAAGKYLSENIEKATGLKVLGYFDYGVDSVAMRDHNVHSPADLKGEKIRITDTGVPADIFKALGATPENVEFSETYTSLQSGLLDGAEVPLTSIVSNKIYEVAKHVTVLGENIQLGQIAINSKFYDSLPASLQQDVSSSGASAALVVRKDVLASEASAQSTLENAGATFNTLTPQETVAFQNLLNPLTKTQLVTLGPDAQKFVKLARTS